jgi:hypothetical protein
MSSSRVHTSLTGARPLMALHDLRGFQQVVGLRIGAAAEAATGIHHVELHLLELQAEHLRQRELVAGVQLFAVPHLAAGGVELHDAVQRLHRCMGEEGEGEFRLDHLAGSAQRRFGVAVLARGQTGRLRQFAVAGDDGVAAAAVGGGFVPR